MKRVNQPAEIEHLAFVPDLDILVFSDSHGDSRLITRCLDAYPDTGLILHLGDHESSLQPAMHKANRPFLAVAGNCDWLTADHLPDERFFVCAGLGIYMCHGHLFHVKRGYGELRRRVKKQDDPINLVLFGHTHIPLVRTESLNNKPVIFANPGAAGRRFSSGHVSALLIRIRKNKLIEIRHLSEGDVNESAKQSQAEKVNP